MTRMVVHKYPLSITDVQVIEAPIFAQALSLQMQNGRPTLWMLVNLDLPKCGFRVQLHGTGIEIPGSTNPLAPASIFIGTVQLPNGLVFHGWIQPIVDTP